MSITTFAVLKTTPNAQTDFLLRIKPKKRLENWTKTGGRTNVYEVAWTSIFEASSSFGNTFRSTSSVEHNGTTLSSQSSTADVDSNAGSFWHDTANDKLYIHTTDSSNPDNVVNFIVVFFQLFISSGIGKSGNGKIFSDIYYEPLLSSSEFPSVLYEQTDIIVGGGMKVGSLKVACFNTKEFWNTMWTEFSWKNAEVEVYFGGEDLAIGEYELVFSGFVRQESWQQHKIEFDCVNRLDLLKRTIPVAPLFGANVSEIDSGKPIPLCFGDVHGVAPLLSDDSIADGGVYTIADSTYQTLKAVDEVRDGTTVLTLTTQYTVDLSACTITLVSYTPTGSITCDVRGAKISDITGESSTDLMVLASDIIKFILIEVLGIPTSKLNSASFTSSRTDNTFSLAKYLRYRRNASSYFAEIERSVMGNIYINNDGEFQFDIWDPTSAEDDTLEDTEMDRFITSSPISKVFEGLKLYYDAQPRVRAEAVLEGEVDTYKTYEVTNNRSKYVDKQASAFKHFYTWIKSLADATVHGDRIGLLTDSPIVEIDVHARGIKFFQRKPGDVLAVTRNRAPTSTGSFSSQGFQIVSIKKQFAHRKSVLKLDNLRGLGLFIGQWTLPTAPDWSTATPEEREQSGFWSDPSGFCDPADLSSLNKSLWW